MAMCDGDCHVYCCCDGDCHVYSQLNEDVIRKRADYQKSLDYYRTLRARFEEHYIKGE